MADVLSSRDGRGVVEPLSESPRAGQHEETLYGHSPWEAADWAPAAAPGLLASPAMPVSVRIIQ
jgi:hypothetical protein